MYRVLDLFAGAGGLSRGFLQTKQCEIPVAVENNRYARETYKRNHKGTEILGDIRDISDYDEFQRDYGKFDVVIGGPPCQGFSNANRQNSHIVNQNNRLVKKYVEFIVNLQPKAFVMENVRMLKSDIHRFYLSNEDGKEIEELGIALRTDKLILYSERCPIRGISRWLLDDAVISRLVLPKKIFDVLRLAFKNSLDDERPGKISKKLGNIGMKTIIDILARTDEVPAGYKAIENEALVHFIHYMRSLISFSEAERSVLLYIKVQQSLISAKEILDNHVIVKEGVLEDESGVYVIAQSFSVVEYLERKLGKSYVLKDKVLNAADFGVPQLRHRYIIIGIRKDLNVLKDKETLMPQVQYNKEEYRTVSDAIKDLENIPVEYEVNSSAKVLTKTCEHKTALTDILRDSRHLHNHVATSTRDVALRRFAALKEGQNFHDLDPELVRDTYTRGERTQNTIYLRLNYQCPSGTVLNVRKSMWVHPTLNRAISIREAARLQTFPDSFVFVGTKDSQYQQVGNAVPPMLGKAIAQRVLEMLAACENSDNKDGGECGGGLSNSRPTSSDDVAYPSEKYGSGNDCAKVSIRAGI